MHDYARYLIVDVSAKGMCSSSQTSCALLDGRRLSSISDQCVKHVLAAHRFVGFDLLHVSNQTL